MRPIDPYSYHCGVMDSFCEIVGAGVKPMALSHPFASPEERAEYREYAAKMAGQYSVLLAEEDSLPVTPLFPADACEGAYVFLFIGSQAVQERYRALRDRTAELRRTGQYDLQSRLEAARELGRLLGYTPEATERMIASNLEA